MCPLRLILIFLSTALAGFFVLRNLASKPNHQSLFPYSTEEEPLNSLQESAPPSFSSKVVSAVGSGFWTCIDMASGRYLWRTLVSSSSSSSSTHSHSH